jgi:hypothetical protein
MAIYSKHRVTDEILEWGAQQLIIYHVVSTEISHMIALFREGERT